MNSTTRITAPSIRKSKSVKPFFRVAPVCLMTWLALSYVTPVQAKIIADLNQVQKPGVIYNANGSTTVNISSASANGISHNKFLQFNVTNKGVVLNNSDEKVASMLAGTILGNKNLTKKSADLIINEVTTNRPSQLSGMIEVAGKKANVIIANPSGINCDSCGFLNTGHSTLTTGKVLLDNGNLTGIDVSSGNITISGKGMNDNSSDYTSLLANTVNVNGLLVAKDLQIMAGKNKNVTIVNNQLSNTVTDQAHYQNTIGLDVSRIGGMYANKITLVGNQKGVGVSNIGGIIYAATKLNIDFMGNITNNGSIIGDKIGISAYNLTNKGDLKSSSTTDIKGTNISNLQNGKIQSGGDMNIAANYSVINDSSTIKGDRLVNIEGTHFTNNAAQVSGKDVNIYSRVINSEQGEIHGNNIKLLGLGIHIANAKLDATNNIDMQSDIITNNVNTTVNAGNDLTLISLGSSFTSRGKYSSGNDINLTSFGYLYNYASINAGNDNNIDALSILNSRAITSGNNINLNAYKDITNNSSLVSKGNVNLYADGFVTNNGVIFSDGKVDIEAKRIFHNGMIM